jgi:hypothetical protein
MIFDGVVGKAIYQTPTIAAAESVVQVIATNADGRMSATDAAWMTAFKAQIVAGLNTTAQQDLIFFRIFSEWFLTHAAAKAHMQSSTSIVAGVVTSGGA